MPTVKVTVDDTPMMDGDLGEWTTEPPFISEQKLAIATNTAQPWAMAVLSLIAKAAMSDQPAVIDVHTRPNGWTLDVTDDH